MKKYEIAPSHFDEVNKNECLKYVLVGITPGTNQTSASSVSRTFAEGTIEYKFDNAFRGVNMRNNLDKMFKRITKERANLSDLIHYSKIDELFAYSISSIFDFTSLIKDKVTVIGAKSPLFNKPSQILKDPALKNAFEKGFWKDYKEYYCRENVTLIACGKAVYQFLLKLGIPKERLIAIVHPSPAANGYIKRFLLSNADINRYNPEQ